MVFFIDTNFFLHCKKYDQLNWSAITSDEEITIIITRPVQIEIDKLKNDGNTRRSKRARETTSLFRKILDTDSLSVSYATPKNKIILKFAKHYPDAVLLQLNPSFDLSSNDDKILAIYSSYLIEKFYCPDECAFFSNDTNPLLTAKLMGLSSIQIPDDWLLEPENDDKDKEILFLKNQLKELQNKEPIIDITLNANDYIKQTDSPNEFKIQILLHNQVESSDINNLVDLLVKKHPQKSDFPSEEDKFIETALVYSFFSQSHYPPSENEINEYNTLYEKWRKDINALFSSYATEKNKHSHIIPFEITLKNSGNTPAMDFLLDFDVLSGGQLVIPDFDDGVLKKRLAYPTPPKPPSGRWVNPALSAIEKYASILPRFANPDFDVLPVTLPSFSTPFARDKTTFYWKDGKPKKNSSSWKFECSEFRHKLNDEQFPYYLVLDENCNRLVFQIRASASNMSSPVLNKYFLNVSYASIDTKHELRHLIEFGVTEDVMKKIENNDKGKK